MSDLLDEFNKILNKDLVPILVKYFKDPNNKVSGKMNEFLNDPLALLTDIFEKFPNNKDNDINQGNFTDIENVIHNDSSFDEGYDDLFKRLSLIEENMIQIEKILKDKN